MKLPKNFKCGLCGKSLAVPDSMFRVSSSYRLYFCRGCTMIILELIRKQKLVWVREKYELSDMRG